MLNWGDAVILNTTFHGNVSWKGRGALESYGKLRVVASTFTDNFGYEYSAVGGGGESVFRNNLIVGNHVVDQVPDACGGAFVSQGGNIVGGIEDTCWSFVDGYKGDGVGMQLEEVVESFENPAWPYLGMRKALLNDNGGPTPTVALLPDSPAIDAIASGACVDDQGNALLTDQRGVLRPQGAACDVGAFELSLPRGLGFWAHQCSDKNFKQISSVELQALFDEVAQRSVVFPECAPIECGALEPQTPRGDMRKRAEQHLLGAWLNLVSGRLTMGRPIELAGSTGSTTVGEALDEMEAVVCDPTATRGELERVKDIAEALNGNGEDMELVALEPNLTVRPGEARLVTLGLVNMSQDHRNYQLHVTGPWPTRVSTTRVNGLGSGQAALLTATVVAPLDAGGQTGRISISATDLQSAASLEREAIIKVRVVDNTPSKDPGGRLPRIE
jgi:hypothetical protein